MEQERRPHSRNDEGGEDEGDDRGRGGPMRRVRVCQFCVEKNKAIDYKNIDLLRSLVSDRGKTRPRRQTGTCAKHQRGVSEALKRARHMALLPFSGELQRG